MLLTVPAATVLATVSPRAASPASPLALDPCSPLAPRLWIGIDLSHARKMTLAVTCSRSVRLTRRLLFVLVFRYAAVEGEAGRKEGHAAAALHRGQQQGGEAVSAICIHYLTTPVAGKTLS